MNWRNSPPTTSLKQKVSFTAWFFCCFRGAEAEGDEGTPAAASLLRSSSIWIRSKAGELPELTERCKEIMARISRSSRREYGEFRYDPPSYALNFDEGGGSDDADDAKEFPYRNFSSRLPSTPPHPAFS
ncbi:uncharacterized protein LOC110094068 [Dendrobium catenatum]|uniref:Uncharacterized protein n=1 Tax=Dendrobium catenatum TaxID=906689 RepID=A0A2I0XBW0_9ASPA|nr:uncharacterized protein LOC110094068 [Dendrobium catenatum]PKU85391.1 hypothetical protein MA16_Dca003130 [Dendrobium catenatum]